MRKFTRRAPDNSPFVSRVEYGYIAHVNRLTRQEQLVLCSVLGLLLVGLAVKTYRTAHPPANAANKPAASLTSTVPEPGAN